MDRNWNTLVLINQSLSIFTASIPSQGSMLRFSSVRHFKLHPPFFAFGSILRLCNRESSNVFYPVVKWQFPQGIAPVIEDNCSRLACSEASFLPRWSLVDVMTAPQPLRFHKHAKKTRYTCQITLIHTVWRIRKAQLCSYQEAGMQILGLIYSENTCGTCTYICKVFFFSWGRMIES